MRMGLESSNFSVGTSLDENKIPEKCKKFIELDGNFLVLKNFKQHF